MAVRKVVKIDEELCDGCGLCVPSCAEGAIRIIDGKARLIGDNLCDGLGACLGECPQGAISVEEREAADFDEQAVIRARVASTDSDSCGGHSGGGGCPGASVRVFDDTVSSQTRSGPVVSMLRQWPVQLHLLPPTAPFLRGAGLVLAADCVAFAVGDFHQRFMRDRALAIACPKLDSGLDVYIEKLTGMIDLGGIDTITVVVMEVPCCNGLLAIARQAVENADRKIPLKMIRAGLKGDILEERWVLS